MRWRSNGIPVNGKSHLVQGCQGAQSGGMEGQLADLNVADFNLSALGSLWSRQRVLGLSPHLAPSTSTLCEKSRSWSELVVHSVKERTELPD